MDLVDKKVDTRDQVALTNRPRRKRRPNASGFAKTDCHTCVQAGKTCDRLLPKCETCLGIDEECGGYVVALKWGSTVVTEVKVESTETAPNADPAKSKGAQTTGKSEPVPSSQNKQIKFKVGKPKKSRVKVNVNDEGKRESRHGAAKKGASSQRHELVQIPSSRDSTKSPISLSVTTSRSPSPLVFPVSVEYSSLAHKMSGVLEMYDREFCKIHLTSDIELNPFRCQNIASEGSKFLLHAILATSSLHMARFNNDQQLSISTLDHKNQALRLFRQALPNVGRLALTLLDAVMILFTVDAALSASGPWRLHLTGAYSILENSGGIKLLGKIPALRPKLAMFLWWDVIVSLVSRRPMVFPYEYVNPTLYDTASDGWSTFDLNGIPEVLFIAMVKITQLHTTPTDTEIQARLNEIGNTVKAWKNEDSAFGTEHTLEATDATDRYHLAESWRSGILLYLSQTFPTTIERSIKSIPLANMTLSHIACINNETTIRKQIFLPLFLAGSEMSLQESRNFCRDYCLFFSGSRGYKDLENSCGYGMFANAGEMLEEIWAERDLTQDETFWWGDVVDRSTTNQNGLESQFLFG